MDKRKFLKTSSTLVAGSMLAPLAGCQGGETATPPQAGPARTNWAGNLTYSAEHYHVPQSVEALQEIIRQQDQIRFLGTRHCFNDIADCPAHQVSMEHFDQIIELNEENQTLTVGAGIKYGDLSPYLYEKGYMLHNLASLPHISVAGACATATHGSGMGNGNLATAVVGMELINGKGEKVVLTEEKDGDAFYGAVVGLGGLGAVTQMTLKVMSAVDMRQDIYLYVPVAALAQNFEAIMSRGYSVSLFTDWQTDTVNQVWIKSKVEEGATEAAAPTFYGGELATKNVHPIMALSAENCTDQMGVPGPWYERLPHFKMNFTPSSGKELQSEFFVPLARAMEAFQAIEAFAEEIGPLLMISEIRAIAADPLWMSPCYQQPCIAFHFTWEQDWNRLQHLLPKIEAALYPLGARPHWGKLFTFTHEQLAARYARMGDFQALLKQHDPEGKFTNAYLKRNIWGEIS